MRRPNIRRPVPLNTCIPEDLRGRIDLYLYSPLEQRVPVGAYQKFICSLIEDFFTKLDKGGNDAANS